MEEMMSCCWQTMDTAPIGERVLFWWVPRTPNPLAECEVIGMLSADTPGQWWNPAIGDYQDVSHLVRWMPLPGPPVEYMYSRLLAERAARPAGE